jgi:hypothetical protein
MKNLLRLLILVALPVTGLRAQVSFDYFGFHASSMQSLYAGWGGGMNTLFAPMKLNSKSIFPVNMQLGGGFYFADAGQAELKDVSMDETRMNITFSNSLVSGYALARFTIPSAGKTITPYLDVFAGMKSATSSMTNHPEDVDHEECEMIMLNKNFGFSGGAGTGVLVPLSKNMRLDFGMQWSGSTATGKYVDMKSVVNTGDGIAYSMKNAPKEMLFVKVGIQFTLGKEGCCGLRGCEIPGHHSETCGMECKK